MLRKLLRSLPTLLGVCLLVGAVYVVWKEFRTLNIADIGAALSNMPRRAVWLAAVWAFLSYFVLTFYDRLGTLYAGNKVSYGRVSFASFCAYSLSHNLGFAAVSGAAVRYRLYAHWGLTPVQIAKVIAFCSLTFGLGGMVLGGAVLVGEPDAVPFFGSVAPHWAMAAVGVLLWAVVAGYVSLSRFVQRFTVFGHEIELPNWRMAILQVLLAAVDVAVTVNIMYQLLPDVPGLSYGRFLGVYLASYSAGLAANVPGGIGVFDSAMLLGLKGYMDEAQILAAIVVFRLLYYIIPLFLAGSLFAGNELLLRGGALLGRRAGAGPLARRAQAMARWSEPALAVLTATGAVTLCGALLLSLGILNQQPDFSWIDPDYADLASEASQFVPSLIGAALMVMAVGLSRRVTLAWGGTIVLLLLAAGFTAVQDEPIWIPAVLVLATVLVAPFRSAYYRHARLLAGPLGGSTVFSLLALVLCVLALGAFEPRLRALTVSSWWEVVLSPDVPNQLRITVLFAVALALVALWRLIRPVRVQWLPWAGEGRRRYAALGAVPPGQADGIVMGETGRAGIPFRRHGRVLLGLGDPAGSVNDRVSAIWRLRDLAQQEGLDPAVWRAGPGLLKVYEDLGMTALPLDAAGLPVANDEPGTTVAGQFLCCVAERDLPVLLPLLPKLADAALQDAAD